MRSVSPPCGVCEALVVSNTISLQCVACKTHFYRHCLGLHKHSFLAGESVCTPCTLFGCKSCDLK